MSSPATPIKHAEGASKYSPKVAMPSLEKLFSSSSAKKASQHEPSPASTYGDTATGDSVPATPLTTLEREDNTTSLIQSLRDAQLENSAERFSGSPIQVRDSKHRTQSERRADMAHGGVIIDMYTSPSKPGLTVTRFQSTSATSSPSVTRYQQISESPSWRRKEEFVRQSQDQTDDPFVTSVGTSKALGEASPTFRPRDDRIGLELSPDTAQAILPPNACVFVANLSHTRSDEHLEHSVTNVFRKFGSVYVKIRRDTKGMPFAFCQYENAEDAQRAISLGRGTLIDGRYCRTEAAKVNRSLYLSRVNGEPITNEEAREVLEKFGALEKVWHCSQTDKEMFRLPEGIWVMFAYFQDCRDAQGGFRDDPLFRLEQPKIPDDIRARLGGQSSQSSTTPLHRLSPSHKYASPQSAMRRAADLCSIFVGNLPADANEVTLQSIFGAHGHIHQIEIVRKPSINANGVNGFAFIEYFSQEEAARAAHGDYVLSGVRLRVERKETFEPSPRRKLAMMPGGSPRERYVAENEMMALMFQRGLSLGLANAAASPAPNMHPQPYAPYAFYQPFSHQPAYNQFGGPAFVTENEIASGLHMHGNTYMSPNVGSYQYQHEAPQYETTQSPGRPYQFTQEEPQYNTAQTPVSPYQWPRRSSNADNVASSEAAGTDTQ